MIERHNAEADQGLHTFRMGVNQYADMTGEEFAALLTNANNVVHVTAEAEAETKGAVFTYDPSVTVPKSIGEQNAFFCIRKQRKKLYLAFISNK